MANILSAEDRRKAASAVVAAESRANGEIVPVFSQASDNYADVALAWSAAIALVALCALEIGSDFYLGLVDRSLGMWAHRWTPHEAFGLALFVAAIKFAGMWLLMLWRPLRLWLTPGAIKARRVRARAMLAFRLAAQGRTHGATGVVIFLSLAERRAEIVADAAIASRVPPEIWGNAMHAMLTEIRAGRTGDGLVAAIEQVGQVLAEHFPREAAAVNELPDGVIEL
ncbi:TPM domain-containing protein [Novosphingobium nitrogenifigens]